MAKNSLGRGLGELLREGRHAPVREGGVAPKASGPQALGPGLRVLAQQRHGLLTGPPSKTSVSAQTSRGVVVGSLLLVDITLVGVTLLWRHEVGGVMGLLDAFVCIGAIFAGAWAAALGAWLRFKE